MKELDVLLFGFLERRFDDAEERLQSAFVELLEHHDPVIADWIWGRADPPDNDIADVIRYIRTEAGLERNGS
jgi:succinate dehydrogenase flavin-adding protein (antitoxin of CptAB toxin-antitoxin module)